MYLSVPVLLAGSAGSNGSECHIIIIISDDTDAVNMALDSDSRPQNPLTNASPVEIEAL